jgi:ankyrin repeat protein
MGPLHFAARRGDLTSIKRILEEQPDMINTVDEESGKSALALALEAGYTFVVRFLLDERGRVEPDKGAEQEPEDALLHSAKVESEGKQTAQAVLGVKAKEGRSPRQGCCM